MLTFRVKSIAVRPICLMIRVNPTKAEDNTEVEYPVEGARAVVYSYTEQGRRVQTTLTLRRVREVSQNCFDLELS